MKSVIRAFILLGLVLILVVVAQPLSLLNENVGLGLTIIIVVMMGMIISELFVFCGAKISNILPRRFRKK